jgi:D-arabinose 1-dehydrogenase-like Zn-dependent alcohol dehydrogenase
VQLGCDSITKGGRVIVVGLFGGEVTLSTPLIPMRALTMQGSYVGNLAELEELMELVRRERPAPVPVTCRGLHEAHQALEDLEHGRVVGRAVLQPAR